MSPQWIAVAPDVWVDWYDAVDLMRQLLDQADSGRPDRDLVAELLPLLRAGGLLEGWTDDWNEHSRNTYRRAADGRPRRTRGCLCTKRVVHYACVSL